MRRFHPTSTLGLTGIGFSLVVLPLAAAIVTAIVRIDHIAELNQLAALRYGQAADDGRSLMDRLVAMERALGQHDVFGDAAFHDTYVAKRREFIGAAQSLLGLDLGHEHRERVQALLAAERDLFAGSSGPSGSAAPDEWGTLSLQARTVFETSVALAQQQMLAAVRATEGVRQQVLVQTAAVFPLSIALAVVFTVLITRPIRRVDAVIRQLAADSLKDSVEIEGPRDLREIGECLDALRQRIVSLEREKLVFVRRISHELKTPLAVIRQGAELLADRSGTPPDEAVEIGGMLKECSLELQGLIEDLLEFGKTQKLDPAKVSRTAIRLDDLLSRTVADHALTLRSKGIVLRFAATPVVVDGDARQLRTVLNNVFANAVKYTPPHGAIDVVMEAAEGCAVVEVRDSGPGIAAGERDKVFEPFYQGAPAAGAPIKGTGLGLAIAKDYVESHGGRIDVLESERGARLRIVLPAARER